MGVAARHGRAAEALAASYLELAGMQIAGRNTRIGGVEVDLVAVDRAVRVVVEVKYRARSDFGGAAAAVDRSKRERLLRAASALIAEGHPSVRIDVVAIQLRSEGAELVHYRGAVER
jgi:putative endonuclease